MFDPDAYVKGVLKARRLHLAIDRRVLNELLRIMRGHADELARLVRANPSQMQRLVLRLHDRLARRVDVLLSDGIKLQFSEVRREMDRLTFNALRSEPGVAVEFVPRVDIQSAAAFLSRGSVAESFRTLAQGIHGAGVAVDALVSEALTIQMSPEELARKLRPYVQGNGGFSAEEMRDLRGIGRERLLNAREMVHNARRIAITEMGNAAHEAQVQALDDAPMVEAVRWRLSPVRGTQTRPDECDILAFEDIYGMGAGFYPTKKVPIRPHPYDRCWLQSKTRDPSKWNDPKPNPEQVNEPTDTFVPGLTPRQTMQAIASAKRAIAAGANTEAVAA